MSALTLGGKAISFDELLRGVLNNPKIVLDKLAVEKLPEGGNGGNPTDLLAKQLGSLSLQGSASAPLLNAELSRAVVLLRTAALLHPLSGGTRRLVDRLCATLNAHTHLPLPSDATTDAQGLAALAQHLVEGLSESEAAAVCSGDAYTVGRLCVSYQLAKTLQLFSEGAFALAIEALGLPKTGLEPAFFENCRPHPAAVQSAKNLRCLLEESKVASAKPEVVAQLGGLTTQFPYKAGAVAQALEGLLVALKSELKAQPPNINPGGAPAGEEKKGGKKEKEAAEAAAKAAPFVSSVQHLASSTLTVPALGLLTAVNQLTQALGEALKAVQAANAAAGLEAGESAPAHTHTLHNINLTGGATTLCGDLENALSALRACAVCVVGECVRGLAKAEEELNKKTSGAPAKELPANLSAEKLAQIQAAQKKVKKLNIGKGAEQLKSLVMEQCPDISSKDYSSLLLKHFSGYALCSIEEQLVEFAQPRNQETRKPKVAKGTQDFSPVQMAIREQVFRAITDVFKRHGAVQIDTPVFELKETLMGKYGEDQKLIYDLKDQGGEQLSLRYDLTVPFARYVASANVDKIKRYHIGKVYRRDEPQMKRGRFREFYQCDFDVAGSYDSMIPDAEVIGVLVDILRTLNVGDFVVKLNHRLVLDSILKVCGVPKEKTRPICSAVDKLDKEPWENVKKEMVELKGLDEACADKIGKYVLFASRDPPALLKELCKDEALSGETEFKKAAEELQTLFDYLGAMGCLSNVSLDMSLARGLDYYTGVIYEAVLIDAGVGSVGAGGRYDTLVGMFAGKTVPAVGVSLGVERIFSVIERRFGMQEAKPEAEEKAEEKKTDGKKEKKEWGKKEEKSPAPSNGNAAIRENVTDVLVCTLGGNDDPLVCKRLQVASELWHAGIPAEFLYKNKMHIKKQLDHASESRIPIVVLIGEDEMKKGTAKIRQLLHGSPAASPTAESAEPLEIEVSQTEIVSAVKKILQERSTSAQALYDAVLNKLAK